MRSGTRLTGRPTRTRRALALLAAGGLALGLAGLSTPSASATPAAPEVTWGAAGSLTSYEGDLTTLRTNALHMAMSRDGTRAVAVWQRITAELMNPGNINSDKEVWGAWATITNGVATWSPAHELSDTGTVGRDPDVSMSADGSRAVVVWEDEGSGWSALGAALLTFSGSTATWHDSMTAIDSDLMAPIVRLSADGSTFILAATPSQIDSGPVTAMVGDIANDGTMAFHDYRVLADPLTQSYGFDADISADGTLGAVVWNQSDATDTIRAAAWADGGWVNAGHYLLSADGAWTTDPRIAMADDGRGVVSWVEYPEPGGTTTAHVAPVYFVTPQDPAFGSETTIGSTDGPTGEDIEVVPAISDDGARVVVSYAGYVNGSANVVAAYGTWGDNQVDWSEQADTATLLSGDVDAFGPAVTLSADHSRATATWMTVNGASEQLVGAVADTTTTSTVWDSLGADAAGVSATSDTLGWNGLASSTDGGTTLAWWTRNNVPQWTIGTESTNAPPTITSAGVANGRSYTAPPPLTCRATEPAGGTVTCKVTTRIVSRTTSWTTYRYTITAKGSTGLVTTSTGTYKVTPFYLNGLRPDSRGVYTLVLGRSYAFIANTPTKAPRYYLAVKAGPGLARRPGPAAGLFKSHPTLRWVVYIHPDKAMLGPTIWNIGARTPDGVMHVLHVRVIRPAV